MTTQSPRPADYSQADVVMALREVGLRRGDIVLTHSSIGMLGRPAEGLDKAILAEIFLSAMTEALGAEGVWILPAYTYSFASGAPFDPLTTPPGNMGLLTEVLWRDQRAARSRDPLFSVIAFGSRAAELLDDLPRDCFGHDSIYARLLEKDGAICNIGIGSHSALIHHVEQKIGVSYRLPKQFSGTVVADGEPHEETWTYWVRDLDEPRHEPYFMRLDRDGRADGSIRAVTLGRGEVNLIRARRMEELIRLGLEKDPEYLVLGDQAGMPIG